MKLTFDTVDELREFVKTHLKNPRSPKGGEETDAGPSGGAGAPALAMPPNGGAAFPAQAQPTFTPPANFPGAGNPGVDPAVQALINRVVTRIDGSIQSGQPADAVLTWFRGQCGPEAAAATLDQIKQVFLAKLPVPSLENIAKLMNA